MNFLKTAMEDRIKELGELLGFEFTYVDGTGRERIVPLQVQQALLTQLGYPASTEKEVLQAIEGERKKVWLAGMEPVRVLTTEEAGEPWSAYLPEGILTSPYRFTWTLLQEHGRTVRREIPLQSIRIAEKALVNGKRLARMVLPPPPTPPVGYHLLELAVSKSGRTERELHCRFILTPASCYLPPELRNGAGKLWGISADLYALWSEKSWGVGDFRDLAAIVSDAAAVGAAVVALNPLHLVWNRRPQSISPYYPVSRLYRNPLYLCIETVPEFEHSDQIRAILSSESFRSQRREAQTRDLVDYEAAAALKYRLIRALYESFMARSFRTGDERDLSFREYRKMEGQSLRDTATFLSLHDHFRRQTTPLWDWRTWPAEFRRNNSPAVKAFSVRHRWEVRFHEYVQWCLDDQLAAAASAAHAGEMPIGLLCDLAVGSDPAGTDAWANQDLFLDGVEMGAPPDAFNMLGQTWGIPPLDPVKLREGGYEFFVRLLRSTMRHAGAIRIDHILGFFRSFCVLRGRKATDGAYIRFPAEDLLKILALESHRNHTMVVGEDLGVVPPVVHTAMERFSILSSRIVYFERLSDGEFRPPGDYPGMAWAALNTHDLPTLAGWWKGDDIDIKRDLHLFPTDGDDDYEGKMRWERGVDRWRLLCRLHENDLVTHDVPREPAEMPEPTQALRDGLLGFLAQTPCALVTVSVADLLLMRQQQNVPGTVDEYPNWSRRAREAVHTEVFLDQLGRAGEIFARRGLPKSRDRNERALHPSEEQKTEAGEG